MKINPNSVPCWNYFWLIFPAVNTLSSLHKILWDPCLYIIFCTLVTSGKSKLTFALVAPDVTTFVDHPRQAFVVLVAYQMLLPLTVIIHSTAQSSSFPALSLRHKDGRSRELSQENWGWRVGGGGHCHRGSIAALISLLRESEQGDTGADWRPTATSKWVAPSCCFRSLSMGASHTLGRWTLHCACTLEDRHRVSTSFPLYVSSQLLVPRDPGSSHSCCQEVLHKTGQQ